MKAGPQAHPPAASEGFCRLFPRAAPRWREPELEALAATMVEPAGDRSVPPGMPAAGFTYLGQFIDHDVTADPRLFRRPHAGAVPNQRTPWLDLDSVYGDGPNSPDAGLYSGDRLRLDPSGRDLVRRRDGKACIKDRRNDSNRIVGQLHVAFARFHNRVVDTLGRPSPTRFDEARAIVCRHYQWIVRHEYLPRIVGEQTMAQLVGRSADETAQHLRCVVPGASFAMPLEFAAAAFRFGHSMVRSAYRLSTDGGAVLLFDTGRPEGRESDDLRGFRPLTPEAVIDWAHFFPLDAAIVPQPARPIDPLLTRALARLPFGAARDHSEIGCRLAFRNLHRGELDLGLATGQEVARALRRRGVPLPDVLLGDEALPVTLSDTAAAQLAGFARREMDRRLQQATPLWYYVLAEAEQLGDGGVRLGPVGGRLVAETFLALLLSDPGGIERSGWRPNAGEFGCRDGSFGMAEMLRFALAEA